MKTTFLCALFASLPLASSWAQNDPTKAAEMIRETKQKVIQRQLEATLTEKLELEKQLLIAPADQQETIKAKAAALGKYCESLELQLAQPVPPAKPSPAELKKSALDQVRRLQQWRSKMDAMLRLEILRLRQTTTGELKKLASNTEPAISNAMLAAVRRLDVLEPETPLESPPPSPATLALKGIWEHGLAPFRKGCWSPEGIGFQPDGMPTGTWTWLDESQGLFVVDDTGSQWMNLCHVVNGDLVESVVIKGAQFKYKRKAPESPAPLALPAYCDLITKLVAAEKALREKSAKEWKQETEKTAIALESIQKDLPETDRAELAKTAAQLQQQTCFQRKIEPSQRTLSGKWIIEGKTFEFISDGIVLVNGKRKGKWQWGKARSHSCIVFTLGAGNLTALGELGDGNMELHIIGAESKHAVKQ